MTQTLCYSPDNNGHIIGHMITFDELKYRKEATEIILITIGNVTVTVESVNT